MNIVIDDRLKNSRLKQSYVATFSTENIALKLPYVYPVSVNPTDAEQVIFILESIIVKPEVYAYFVDIIPQSILPSADQYKAKDLIQAFVNVLISPLSIKILNLDFQNLNYIMYRDNFTISTSENNFLFPFDSPFINTFRYSYGDYQWQDLQPSQVITDNEFIEADNFINDALSPYQSWFVASDVYDKLCEDLKSVCLKLELLSGQSFFNWNNTLQTEIKLISIIKEDAEIDIK